MLVAILLPTENPHALELAGVKDILLEANRQLGRQAYQLPLLSERAGPVASRDEPLSASPLAGRSRQLAARGPLAAAMGSVRRGLQVS